MLKKAPIIFLTGVFLILDQWLKWQALHAWSAPHWVLHGWLGWELFLNTGIAFSIPVPAMVTVVGTLPVIVLLVWMLLQRGQTLPRFTATALVLAGATSNLIDRIVYHATVDYIRLFTAVVNLADALIVAGFVVYVVSIRKKKE